MSMESFESDPQPSQPEGMFIPKRLWQLPAEKRDKALGALNSLYESYVSKGLIAENDINRRKKFTSGSLFIRFTMEAKDRLVKDAGIILSQKGESGDISSVDLVNLISSYIQDSRGVFSTHEPEPVPTSSPTPEPTEVPRKKQKPLRVSASAMTTSKAQRRLPDFSTQMRAANDKTVEDDDNSNYLLSPEDNQL